MERAALRKVVTLELNMKTRQLEEGRPAYFHQFSQSYEDFENGPGNFPVAIVEYEDGSVEAIFAEHIKFI